MTEHKAGSKPASIFDGLHAVSFVLPSQDGVSWQFDVLADQNTHERPAGYEIKHDNGISRETLAAMLEYAAALLRLPG